MTNWATNVSVVVNPGLQSALATVEAVNRFNPTPSAPILEMALAGVAGVLGFVARLKTKQAAAHAGLAQTLVIGIEEAKSAETKAAVAKISGLVGNAPAVNALVQKKSRGVSTELIPLAAGTSAASSQKPTARWGAFQRAVVFL